MSQLSTAECNAGVSRKALATLLKKQGSNGDSPTKEIRSIGNGAREVCILDTPYRKLSAIESRDEDLILRDVCFVGTKADVALIHLEPEQARTLALALLKIVHA